MPAASYFPGQKMSTTYAMVGDDASLHFDMQQLTPKQQADHDSNMDLMGFLHVALIGLGKPADHVALYDEFRSDAWPEALSTYFGFFKQMAIYVSITRAY